MSIVSLSNDFVSRIDVEDLKHLAGSLGIAIEDGNDSRDFLLLLRSLESVLQSIETSEDYVPKELEPHPSGKPRTYWKPTKQENPLNAWSHRCNIKSNNCSSTLLDGKVIAIKDNISIGGLPTTLGTFSEILSDTADYPISPIDAVVVKRILAAGATIAGSSTCESFCASPLSFTSAIGPVHHPLLRGYTSGGSSSGSCALVAASLLPPSHLLGDTAHVAIGSDQAGSVRIPACYTGLYGLKPSFGLIPYTGAASMTPMIDHLGPIAPKLEDIAALLKVMAGYDGLDSRMTPDSPQLGQVLDYPEILSRFREQLSSEAGTARKMTIGLLKESFDVAGVSTAVKDIIRNSVATFFRHVGAKVVEVSVPMHLEGPSIWTATARPSMAQHLYQGKPGSHLSYPAPHIQPKWPLTQRTYEVLKSSNPAVVNIILSEAFCREKFGPSVEAKAHRKALELRAAYDAAFEDVDILITPCAPDIAMPHPSAKNDRGTEATVMERLSVLVGVTNNTCPFNITGHPALSVPCGSLPVPDKSEVRLPVGMQMIGKRWHDDTVLMAAALFEEGRRLAQLQL